MQDGSVSCMVVVLVSFGVGFAAGVFATLLKLFGWGWWRE